MKATFWCCADQLQMSTLVDAFRAKKIWSKLFFVELFFGLFSSGFDLLLCFSQNIP